MAVGIRFYGGGAGPRVTGGRRVATPPRTRTVSVTGDEIDTTGIGDTGIESTPDTAASSAAAMTNARTSKGRLNLEREKFKYQRMIDAQTRADELAKLKATSDFNLRQFLAEQKAATDALERQRTGATSQADYIKGLLGQGIPKAITDEIAKQETAGKTFIDTQAQNLLTRLAAAQTTAQGAQTSGFDALKAYLTANPARSFEQAQRAVPTVQQNALAQYLTAQGVSPSASQAAVDLANVQAASGAANYNQLLGALAAAESAGQQSRLAEEQMARTLENARLGQIYGTGRANVEAEQLAALNELATRISNARIGAETSQTEQERQLQTALANVIGTGLTGPKPTETPETTEPETETTTTPQVRAATTDWQKLVVARHPNFKGTFNQAKKKFPKLYAQYLEAKKKG